MTRVSMRNIRFVHLFSFQHGDVQTAATTCRLLRLTTYAHLQTRRMLQAAVYL